MMKKLISFICCLVPFGTPAAAVDVPLPPINPGAGNAYSAEELNVPTETYVAVESGKGLAIGSGGITANNLLIGVNSGTPVNPDGTIYVEENTESPYTIQSDGDINISNNLSITTGRTLAIEALSTGTEINLTLGAINANGALTINKGINNFTSGAISSAADLTINAESITAGAINSTAGNNNITSTGQLVMEQFIADGNAQSNITAGGINSGTIQNITGTMAIKSSGDIHSTGNIENSGTLMEIGRINDSGATPDVVNIVVDGTMKNDSNDATMVINADNLTVSGGDATTNASFINSGNLDINVKGETNLANGFILTGMQNSNTFELDTGTLVFGAGTSMNRWMQVFSNNLNNFSLIVRNGAINYTGQDGGVTKYIDIINGVGNPNANMNLQALSVTAQSVLNQSGTINVTATGVADAGNPGALHGINILGGITGLTGTTTNIVSADDLTVGGTVVNSGDAMVLNGNRVDLQSVVNDGTRLDIKSYTDESGIITINGSLTNSTGETTIEARQIDINGALLNNSGTTNIFGSDTAGGGINIGNLTVTGGVVNLNSLVKSAAITNGLSVMGGGAFNLLPAINKLTVGGNIQISGDVTLSANNAIGGGNVNIAATGTPVELISENGAINIYGNIYAGDANTARGVKFSANQIVVGTSAANSGNVTAENLSTFIFGNSSAATFTATGNVQALNNGIIDIVAGVSNVGALTENNAKIIARGTNITANKGDINIADGIWFDGTNPAKGLVITGTNSFNLQTVIGDILAAGGVSVGTNNSLTMNSAAGVNISGLVNNNGNLLDIDAVNNITFDNKITNRSTLNIDSTAGAITTRDIENRANAKLTANGAVTVGNVDNYQNFTINGSTVTAGAIRLLAGAQQLNITAASSLDMASLNVAAGVANIDATVINSGDIYAAGNLVQGAVGGTGSGTLNLTRNSATVNAASITTGGDFSAIGNSVDYRIANAFDIGGDITVSNVADVDIAANTITAGDVDNNGILMLLARASAAAQNPNAINIGNVVNNGTLSIFAQGAINNDYPNLVKMGTVTNNSGALTLNTGTGDALVDSFTMVAGTATLAGRGLVSAGVFTTPDMLYQNYNSIAPMNPGAVNVADDAYAITASKINVKGIEQSSGALVLNSSDVTIGYRDANNIISGGDIIATDLQIRANPITNWLNMNVLGNVSGNVDFIGLEHMTIGGNYIFNDFSRINAVILPEFANSDAPATQYNYWADVSLADDSTLGQITNVAGDAAKPLISVGGTFVSQVENIGQGSNLTSLKDGQIGIDIFDIVNPGKAIWFLHADDGIQDLATKVRNLNVNFCNADGSLCFNYLDALNKYNSTDSDLPAYIALRDTDGDGNPDSLYIVFDPRFGGPVEIFRIQPIVEREAGHTHGEYVSAGALDNLLLGRLEETQFYNRTPIEAIPLIFKGTNLEQMANELYKRMEYYNLQRDGEALARFSRLFQAREIEQIAGSVVLNEHTTFRDAEDHMFDEFIWNRNRNLRKAWADVDFGMFNQDVADGKSVSGNRFSITGGYDWQESETLILGLMGRVSHMSGDNSDTMDLGYLPGQYIAGHVDVDVADTNIGLGGYLLKTLGTKTRVYGNAFLDIHVLNVTRDQNYVDSIDGTGTAFSLISEWGLLHDWLNQYIVGNVYARVGYNTGFSVTEKAAGDDYMTLKSDGYMILTPGYSLTAQKRIYPSAWFQIRPYASVGIEYDVLGAPDSAKYKFASANDYTKYDINIDPLWANIGGGVEFLSAVGVQVGLDYRYQHNSDIQMHRVRLSGSYRF